MTKKDVKTTENVPANTHIDSEYIETAYLFAMEGEICITAAPFIHINKETGQSFAVKEGTPVYIKSIAKNERMGWIEIFAMTAEGKEFFAHCYEPSDFDNFFTHISKENIKNYLPEINKKAHKKHINRTIFAEKHPLFNNPALVIPIVALLSLSTFTALIGLMAKLNTLALISGIVSLLLIAFGSAVVYVLTNVFPGDIEFNKNKQENENKLRTLIVSHKKHWEVELRN